MHQHKIVHHDIKPQNIMVKFRSQYGSIQDRMMQATYIYIDFGLARQYEKKVGVKENGSKTGGTPFYMSWEKYSSTKPFDPYVDGDCYSLAITMLEIATGKERLSRWLLFPKLLLKPRLLHVVVVHQDSNLDLDQKMAAYQIAQTFVEQCPNKEIFKLIKYLIEMPSFVGGTGIKSVATGVWKIIVSSDKVELCVLGHSRRYALKLSR